MTLNESSCLKSKSGKLNFFINFFLILKIESKKLFFFISSRQKHEKLQSDMRIKYSKICLILVPVYISEIV